MIYPEALLIPVLMISDYYLTILGAVLRDKKYSEYVIVEQYELNPRFQKAVNKRKLFNLKHLFITIAVTGCIIYVAEISPVPDKIVSFFLGWVLILFSVINGRHIANILTFRYFTKQSDQIKGRIEYTYEATLFLAMYYNLIPLIALIIICIYERSLFVLGGIVAVFSLNITHIKFLSQMKKKLQTETAS